MSPRHAHPRQGVGTPRPRRDYPQAMPELRIQHPGSNYARAAISGALIGLFLPGLAVIAYMFLLSPVHGWDYAREHLNAPGVVPLWAWVALFALSVLFNTAYMVVGHWWHQAHVYQCRQCRAAAIGEYIRDAAGVAWREHARGRR